MSAGEAEQNGRNGPGTPVMNDSSSEIDGSPLLLPRTAQRRRRGLRPWVLICLLILTGAISFAVAEPRGGWFFLDIARTPGGEWVAIDKGDRRADRDRIRIAIGATGSLHNDWSLIIYDELGRPITSQEFHASALQALDQLQRANARLEGTRSTSEYQATLRALRIMLATGRDRYVDNWFGMVVEKMCFVLVPVATIGLIVCAGIAASRARVRAECLRRLACIERQCCPTCKYDLQGVPVPVVCPECGTDVEAVEREARRALE